MSLFTYFELKEFDSASLNGSFQNFGSALSRPSYEAIFFNDSDVDVYITSDGTNNQLRIPAGESLKMKSQHSTSEQREGVILFKSGAQLQIKQVTAAGTGFITANILTEGRE